MVIMHNEAIFLRLQSARLQQANLDALCPKPDAGMQSKQRPLTAATRTLLSKSIGILWRIHVYFPGSLEARREKKAAVTSFARQRDDRCMWRLPCIICIRMSRRRRPSLLCPAPFFIQCFFVTHCPAAPKCATAMSSAATSGINSVDWLLPGNGSRTSR